MAFLPRSASYHLHHSRTVQNLDNDEYRVLNELIWRSDQKSWTKKVTVPISRQQVSSSISKNRWSGHKDYPGIIQKLEKLGLLTVVENTPRRPIRVQLTFTGFDTTKTIPTAFCQVFTNDAKMPSGLPGDQKHESLVSQETRAGLPGDQNNHEHHAQPQNGTNTPTQECESPDFRDSGLPEDQTLVSQETSLKGIVKEERKDPDPDPPYSPPMTRNGKPIPTPPPSTPYQTFNHQHITELEADYPLPFQQNPEHTKIVNDWLMDNDQNQGIKNLALMAVNPPDHLKGIWNHKRVQDKINDIIAIEPQRAFIYALKTANELLDLVDEQTTTPTRRPNFAQDDEMTLWRGQGATEGEKSPYRANTGLREIREQASL